jgi:hypothetical protein
MRHIEILDEDWDGVLVGPRTFVPYRPTMNNHYLNGEPYHWNDVRDTPPSPPLPVRIFTKDEIIALEAKMKKENRL